MGHSPAADPVSIPLVHGGEDVGRLLIGLRDPHAGLTGAEGRLLDDVARQVAVATHAVLLDRALRRSRERLVVAREAERRRIRRDLHDGLGPALAGMALGLDAAHNLLRADPERVAALLGALRDEALGCVDEVRRIVDDLRPPTLDGLGLLAALQAFADRLSSRERTLRVEVISVARPLRPAGGRRGGGVPDRDRGDDKRCPARACDNLHASSRPHR